MLFLCGLTCRIILYNRPCTSQRGIALPLWKPLLNQQQYPARITWRFLIRAGAAAPLSNFALTRTVGLKRRKASLHSVRPRSLLPRVCRNTSGKLLSHPLRGADRACCCWLSTVLQHPLLLKKKSFSMQQNMNFFVCMGRYFLLFAHKIGSFYEFQQARQLR